MKLADIRNSMGLTQAQFAELIGVAAAYVGHLETGHRKPSLKLAYRIEAVTGTRGYVDAVMSEKLRSAAQAA